MNTTITIIPETGRQIGRTVFFSTRDSEGWVDFGIIIDPIRVEDNFSFCEITAERTNVFFPESRRIQDFIERRIRE